MAGLMLKGVLKIVLIALSAAVVTAGAVLYFLTATTFGLQFAIDRTNEYASDYVRLNLTVKAGDLWSGFDAAGRSEIVIPGIISVNSDNLSLRYSLLELINRGAFRLRRLSADYLQVYLNLAPGGEEEEEERTAENGEEPFRLNFPFPLMIEELKLGNFSYMSDTVDVVCAEVDLSLEAHDDFAAIRGGSLLRPVVYLKEGERAAGEAAEEPAEEAGEARGGAPALPEDGAAPLSELTYTLYSPDEMAERTFLDPGRFPTVELPLDVAVDKLDLVDGRYYMRSFDTGIFTLSLEAGWQGRSLTVGSLKVEHALGQAELAGSMDFKDWYAMDFSLSGTGARSRYNQTAYEGALYGLEGSAAVRGDISRLSLDLRLEAPQTLTLRGFLRPLDADLPVALTLSSPALRYPLTGGLRIEAPEEDEPPEGAGFRDPRLAAAEDPAVTAENLSLSVSGAVFSTLSARLSAVVSGMGADRVEVGLAAAADFESAVIEELSLKGRYQDSPLDFSFRGSARYADAVAARGVLDFALEDAGGLNAVLGGPLRVEGDFDVTASEEEGLFFNLRKLSSRLTLNGVPAALEARDISGSPDTAVAVGALSFVQDRNSVSLTGSLSEVSDLSGVFALENLSGLLPELEGALRGRIQVNGDYRRPEARLIASAPVLRYGGADARNLIVNSQIALENMEFSFTALLDALRLSEDGLSYRQCSLDLSGAPERSRLALSCGGSGRVYLSAESAYDAGSGTLSGVLSNFMLTNSFTEPISLRHPVSFDYNLNTRSGSVSEAALSDGTASLTVRPLTIENNDLKADFEITGFNLSYLNQLSPRDYRLRGAVTLTGGVAVTGGAPDVKLELTAPGGFIGLPGVHIGYDRINLSALFNYERASASLETVLSHGDGSLKVDLDLREPLGGRSLEGAVSLKDLNLDLFTALGGALNELSGQANAEAQLKGDLASPLLYGRININGSAEPQYNVGTVESFNLDITAAGTSGTLGGQIVVNEGEFSLNGELDWSKGADGEIVLQTAGLPLFLMGYGEASLDLNARVGLGESMSVEGEVVIPQARIAVSSLESSAQSPSPDEIYIEYGGADTLIKDSRDSAPPLPYAIALKVSMGDDVQLDAMGLKANIVGSVSLNKGLEDADIDARGTVSLADAAAEVFGHRYIVNYADTVFNGAIADPQVKVEVVADPFELEDDVVAGVHVTGSAADPRIELFSNPAMSQNEILSYLLYGHGLEKNTDDASGQSSQLLMTLGLGTTTGLINSVAGTLGMNRLQFGSSGSGDETTVGVSTYITKNIRLSYGYGVFTSINEFRVRYEMMRKLYAEIISSLDQSVDLVYSFDFD